MISWFNRIERYLVLVLVFLFPTQLALHFWPSWSFIFGIRVDYLAPTLYLTDIFAVILIIFGFHEILEYKKYLSWLIIFSLINIIFSVSPSASLFKWLKILELASLVIYFANRVKSSDWKNIYQTLFLSLIFFSLIGIDQFFVGHTINGLLYLLGERSFSISTPGIALNSFFGRSLLRAYSTFPHPNVLAGYLGVSTIFLFLNGFFTANLKKIIGLVVITICFFLTFSLTALFAIAAISAIYLFIKNKKYLSRISICLLLIIIISSLFMPIVSERILSGISFDKNISERLTLSIISGKTISQNFWLGTGLNTFTISMTRIKPLITSSWLLQPVHNIFLLTLSEAGIFGLLLLILYFYKSIKVFPLIFIFILITGFFDHYWLDSQQNLLLLALISARVLTPKTGNN